MSALVDAIQAVVNLFTGFIDMIIFVVDFVISTINDLVYMTQLLGSMIIELPSYFGWLPSVVVTNFMLIISIVVIYKVIGREG